MKFTGICMLCFRCVPVGRWYEGQWVCNWCNQHFKHKSPADTSAAMYQGFKIEIIRSHVIIEEIGTEL